MTQEAATSLESLQDAPRYWIEASFDPASLQVTGTERVWFVNRWDAPLDHVYLRLYPNGEALYGPAEMWLELVSDGEDHPLQWKEDGDDTIVRVDLAEACDPDESLEIVVSWGLLVPEGIGHEWTRADGYGLVRQAMGVTLLADWFPMLAVYDGESWHLDEILAWGDPVYSETSFFEVWFTAPPAYTVVSTGMQVSSESAGSEATHHFLSGPAREFLLALSANWQVETAVVGDTVVLCYFFPEDTPSGEEALQASADALQVFDRRFGTYPYKEFEVVEAPLLGVLGMEYPGVILLADRMYMGDQQWRLDITAAHEVAHQWWYGVVGNDVFTEPWLDEAMATFSSGVYVEDVWGAASFEAQYQEWVDRYESGLEQGAAGSIAWPLQRFAGSGPYVSTVYYEGAMFLDALRQEIGVDAFYAALQEYYREFKFRQAEASDLLAVFEQASGRDLDAFYEQWLFGE